MAMRITDIIMTDTTGLLRLMSWLSPVFPTGGFAYSAALEQAVKDGAVTDAESLKNWISALLDRGSQWNDAVLFAESWRSAADAAAIAEVAELGRAMAASAERFRETTDQGSAFVDAAANWFETDTLPPRGSPLCIAVGAACGLQSIPLPDGLAAYLHAFVTNQLQAAIRLSLVGQRGAAALLADLEPVVADIANRAAGTTRDDLGSCTILADIAAMKHETMEPRLFLS
jgi:urease accessory protein